jgi:hypothetical protein
MNMLDAQPTLVQGLVRHVRLPREPLPQIEINSSRYKSVHGINIGKQMCKHHLRLPVQSSTFTPSRWTCSMA